MALALPTAVLRSARTLQTHHIPRLLPISTLRRYTVSTSTPIPKKQQITVRTGDSSSKKWAALSGGEKIVRTASTGVNSAVVLVGLLLTVRFYARAPYNTPC